MKYMGSKRVMLGNGLGEILVQETSGAKRFADLFAGSGSVAWYVAGSFPCRVIANDLQVFSSVLCNAVRRSSHRDNAVRQGEASRNGPFVRDAGQ
jgi:adenine-specific DNA-methyltransferase